MFIQKFYSLPEYALIRFKLYLIFAFLFYIILVGGFYRLRLKPHQKKLDFLRIGVDGQRPQVVNVKKDEDLKTIVRIKAPGIGVGKIQARKDDLQSAFNQNVESISADENSPQYIDVVLSTFPLPKCVRFRDHSDKLTEEGQLFIGQSRQGFKIQKISELPHFLIAGTSGSGKSTFFKQALLGLLKSSPTAQFYLIDLKRGAEFRAFADIHGVKFAKTIGPALTLLREVKNQMMTRFEYIESQGLTKIEPEKHLDQPRIIVAIDEASEILAIPYRGSPDKDDIMEARVIVNDIAKLGRAAAVNLIVATQKVSKTIIDTSLQENMGGRLAFRMATLANSAQVLGSKEANEIPAIEGRGRFRFGTKTIDIQAPYLTDEELKVEAKKILLERRKVFTNETSEEPTKKQVILRDIKPDKINS